MDDLLSTHVERFNEGIRTGDWGPMLEQFADDAELVFVGPPVGPFAGREAIRRAYEEQPPDDEIRVLDERREGYELVAGYAWAAEAPKRAGDLRVTVQDGKIARLVVTFDN